MGAEDMEVFMLSDIKRSGRSNHVYVGFMVSTAVSSNNDERPEINFI
jgi:hypothetical protein